jgi:uncharacterized delta-60 repeat protein
MFYSISSHAQKRVKNQSAKRRNKMLGSAIEILEGRVLLAYTLDPSFSGDGIVNGTGGGSIVVQADNKIVVRAQNNQGLQRFNVDGTTDASFGSGGVAPTPFTVYSVRSSGSKIVVSGYDQTRQTGVLAQFTSNGSLDTSFGGGDGIADVPAPVGGGDLKIAPDGKLVVLSSHTEPGDPTQPDSDFQYYFIDAARFNSDGSLDRSFAGDGTWDESISSLGGGLIDGDVQSDGKILLAYWDKYSDNEGNEYFTQRLNTDGTGDSTFHGMYGDPRSAPYGTFSAVSSLPDNGYLLGNFGRVERFKADGTRDTSFNTNGLGFDQGNGAATGWITDFLPLADGKTLVTGWTDPDAYGPIGAESRPIVARLLPNGNPDTTFSGTPSGMVVINKPASDAYSPRIDSQNRVVLGGATSEGTSNTSYWLARLADLPQTPFKGAPFHAGDIIQAEDFDNGGEGIAYHDLDATNNGGAYRPSEGVDVESLPTSQTLFGFDVGWTNPGEWMEYTVNIPASGNYTIDTRLASPKTGGKFHYEVDGVNASGPITIPNTGSFQTYSTINNSLGTLTAGTHVLRLAIDAGPNAGGQANFDWMKINGAATGGDTQAPSAVPNFHTTNVTNSSVSLAWDAATDNVGVTGYQLTLDPDNTVLLGPDQHSFTFPELAPDHQYTFEIHALDAAGNQGPISSVVATTGSLPVTGGLKGEYFNNSDFTAPVFTRNDPNIDYNWGTGSPDPRIDPDTFSVRWTGKIQVPTTGRYTFYTTTDDGVRLWVNNQLIIDHLTPQAATEWSGGIDLVAGQQYDIRTDYFERAGGAQAKLSWSGPGIAKQIVPPSALSNGTGGTGDTQPPSAVANFTTTRIGANSIDLRWDGASDNNGVAGYELRINDANPILLGSSARTYTANNLQPQTTYKFTIDAFDAAGNRGPATSIFATTPATTTTGNGLSGTYYNNMDFTSPVFTRRDSTINFNWGTGSPGAGIDPDTFSVRWTGQIQVPTTGRYTFYTSSDDGARLTINGQRIIDKLVPQSTTEWSGSIDLVAGQKYNLTLEYFDRAGGANAKLQWSGPGISKQVVPQANLFS